MLSAIHLWEVGQIELDTPDITSGPDGSIDIHWKNPHRELLINIPENQADLANYYGRNKVGQTVEGDILPSVDSDTLKRNQWLTMWLMQ